MCCYAVIDLEMCKVPRKCRTNTYHFATETIQIGAVLLSESLKIVDRFATYVSPTFGYIDSFINRLTGISKCDISDAPDMGEALRRFADWLPENVKAVSWSDSDEIQIQREMKAKNICVEGIERLFENWIDCQKIFSDKLNAAKCYNLTEALNIADIIYQDGAHDGLVDAYNTALLFAKMEREEELKLSPYYSKMLLSEEEGDGFTIGSLFVGIDLQSMVTT